MPRFQSRLFNWIDQSLPAQLGRSVRRSLDQKFRQLAGLSIQELPRLLAYQVAKAALYPVYLIATTTKRVFPALARNKDELREKLRSQPEAAGLLSESKINAENNENAISREVDFKADLDLNIDVPTLKIPLLLRPLAKFLDWIDHTKIRLDRDIAAIVKRSSDNLATLGDTELEPKVIANRIFAEIWRQQIEQKQAEQNSLKESNGLAENVGLGKNTRLEQLRRLIEAAIAYFFGNQSPAQDQRLPDNEEVAEILGAVSLDAEALPDSPKLKRRRVTSTNSVDRSLTDQKKSAPQDSIQKDLFQPPIAKTSEGELQENAPLAESSNLDRLRDLIAAAIDYFIGKRSLDGDQDKNIDRINPMSEMQSELLIERVIDKLQNSPEIDPKHNQNSDALKIDNQLERLQKLIEEAIAYFFGKARSSTVLDEVSDITPSQETWLTMEDVFGDDNGPWPLSLEYESIAFNKSPDRTAIHSSGELQNFETTTTQITQDQLEGSLVFEEEVTISPERSSNAEKERPLRAWIEAKATILGYVYNPMMTMVLWIDAITLKLENLIIHIWKGLISFPKRLINFIRYSKKRF